MKKSIACLLIMLMMVSVGQAETLTGTLTITCKQETTLLSGVQLSLVKVADIVLVNTSVRGDGRKEVQYTLVSELEDLSQWKSGRETFFDDMTAGESLALAKEVVARKLPYVTTITTGNDGKAVFSDLSLGLYAVVQTGKEGISSLYTSYEPYLISVPEISEEEINFEPFCYPKTTIEIDNTNISDRDENYPPIEDEQNPKTNDVFSFLPIGIGLIVAGGIVLFVERKKE